MKKLIGGLALVLTASIAIAGEPAEGENCISMARISKTDVVDSQTIRFYHNNQQFYENRLPRRCPGLGVHRAFSYKTTMRQLCKQDSIRVLNGTSLGSVCMLGEFVKGKEETE